RRCRDADVSDREIAGVGNGAANVRVDVIGEPAPTAVRSLEVAHERGLELAKLICEIEIDIRASARTGRNPGRTADVGQPDVDCRTVSPCRRWAVRGRGRREQLARQ